jgi:hypothetical protein
VSVDSVLDDAFVTLLQKSVTRIPEQGVRPASINFGWGGGGTPLNVANLDPVLIDVPFPSRIIWARIRAGDATGAPVLVSATIDLRLSNFASFGGSTAIYANAGIVSITNATKLDLSLTGWIVDLDIGDSLSAQVLSVATLATWLSLTLLIRPTDMPIGVNPINSGSGSTVISGAGNTLIRKTGP